MGPLVNDTSNPPQLWPRPRGDSTDFELTEVLSLVCSVLVASSAFETKKASACSLSPGRRLDKGSQTECSVNFLQIASFQRSICLGRAHYTSSIGAGMPLLEGWLGLLSPILSLLLTLLLCSRGEVVFNRGRHALITLLLWLLVFKVMRG